MNLSSKMLLLCFISLLLLVSVKCEDEAPTHKDNDTEILLTGKDRNSKIELLLKDPKATFFTGENMTGEAVTYDSTNLTYPGGCQDVKGVKSMRISRSCVRVFMGRNCRDLSRSLYPKQSSGNFINFLNSDFTWTGSVGPCLSNEFQFASVSLNGQKLAITKDETYVRQVPDLVDFTGYDAYDSKSIEVSSQTNPITNYFLDQGRPQWLRVSIRSRHLNNNGSSEPGRNMAIPPGLGGPANEAYNTFPQSENNFVEWKKFTDLVRSHLIANTDNHVRFYMTFAYESSSVTEPYGFYYHAMFVYTDYSKERLMYGFIEN